MTILIVISLLGLTAFALTYRVIAGQISGSKYVYGSAQEGY
jgi:hypothetical protein